MKEETGLEQWLAGAETCGADPTLHHSLQALIETERQREAEMKKEDSLLFYFSPSHCSLSNP